MVERALRLAWLWAALYAVGGCLSLMIAAFEMRSMGTPLALSTYALASLLGCALLAFFTRGESFREGVIAASLIGAAQLLFGLVGAIGHLEVIEFRATFGHPMSTAVVCMAGAALGGRLGSELSRRARGRGATLISAPLASVLLVGALYVHGVLIAFVATLSQQLAIVFCLLALAISPACSAGVLQLLLPKPAENLLVAGIVLIIVFVDSLLLVAGQSLGVLCVSSIVLAFAGAATYAFALPGLFAARSSAAWRAQTPRLPSAIAISPSPGEARKG